VSSRNRVPVPPAHPLFDVASMSVNFVSGRMTITRTDGTTYTSEAPPLVARGDVTSSTYFVHESRVEVAVGDTKISLDVGTTETATPGAIVYLDQNHWVGFARWRKGDTGDDPHTRKFFELLSESVDDGRLIVPLSAAHLAETSRRGGPSRLDLASSMLSLSRGWQMRDAVSLRRGELRSLFGGAPLERSDVFSLDPHVALDRVRSPDVPAGFSNELEGLVKRLSWAAATVSVLMDPQPNPPGIELAARWAASFSELAHHIRGNPKAKPRIRDLTRIRLMTDLGTDLPAAANEAGLSPEEFHDWVEDNAESSIARTPGLARIRELIHLRVSNADDVWEANDLYDMTYLSYAAAYCDLVVGEKKTINYLRRTSSVVPAGAALHLKPAEALPDLEALLAR